MGCAESYTAAFWIIDSVNPFLSPSSPPSWSLFDGSIQVTGWYEPWDEARYTGKVIGAGATHIP